MIHQTIRDYRVLSKLGAGGMGEVWLAEHIHLGNLVAIKVLAPGLRGSGEFGQRFLMEARSQAKLVHPNIVQVKDFFVEKGQYFMVTEYCAGNNLYELITAKGTLTIPVVLKILKPALSALNYAHSQGVIHRDIKPANIMVNEEMEAKIMDFGLAAMAGSTEGGGGSVIGSPHYMSPEQIRDPTLHDHRIDLYAMGIVLFELLTGRLPFDGVTPQEIWEQHLNKKPTSPRIINPMISKSLDRTILKVLEKDPEDRFAGCGELLTFIEYAEQEGRPPQQGARPGITGRKPIYQKTLVGQPRLPNQTGAALPPAQARPAPVTPARTMVSPRAAAPAVPRAAPRAPAPRAAATGSHQRPPAQVPKATRPKPSGDAFRKSLQAGRARLKTSLESLPAPLLSPLLLILAYLVPSLFSLLPPWSQLGMPIPTDGVLNLFYTGTSAPGMLGWSICIFSFVFSCFNLLRLLVLRGYEETSFLICAGTAILAAVFNWLLIFGMVLPAMLRVLIDLQLVVVYYQPTSYSGSAQTDMICLGVWFLVVLLMAGVSRSALLFYRTSD